MAGGCLVDSDNLCDEGQTLTSLGGCACPEGSVLSDDKHGCTEVVPPPAGLGVLCSETTPCVDDIFDFCASAPAGDYCTSDECITRDDCEAGYACNLIGEVAFCQRPPIGQGKSCTTHEDCVDGEAVYCESYLTDQCLVRECSPGSCFDDWDCCDLNPFGVEETLCVPKDECPA